MNSLPFMGRVDRAKRETGVVLPASQRFPNPGRWRGRSLPTEGRESYFTRCARTAR
jgi:hypothetical protein